MTLKLSGSDGDPVKALGYHERTDSTRLSIGVVLGPGGDLANNGQESLVPKKPNPQPPPPAVTLTKFPAQYLYRLGLFACETVAGAGWTVERMTPWRPEALDRRAAVSRVTPYWNLKLP